MHGVAVKGFDVSDPATRASLIRQNCQVHDLEILRLTWLTNPAITKKTVSSVVMEIVNPRTANAIIDSGIYWNKQHLAVERYDPACRLRQCFKCQQFGHIGPQCHSKERCGWCAGPHNSRVQIGLAPTWWNIRGWVCDGLAVAEPQHHETDAGIAEHARYETPGSYRTATPRIGSYRLQHYACLQSRRS